MDKGLHQQIFKLPRTKRLELASELWDSVRDEDIPITAAHRTLLRTRHAAYHANPENDAPLPEFQKKLRDLSRSLRKRQRRSA